MKIPPEIDYYVASSERGNNKQPPQVVVTIHSGHYPDYPYSQWAVIQIIPIHSGAPSKIIPIHSGPSKIIP